MNMKQAPALHINGCKAVYNTQHHTEISDRIFRCINHGLSGKEGTQRSLMFLLIGMGEGFKVTEKYVMDMLNTTQPTYNKARKKLIEKG